MDDLARAAIASRSSVSTLAPPAESAALDSSDACRIALEVYARIYRQCRVMDPDAGFAERYASGRRSIDARMTATSWALTMERSEAIMRFLADVSATPLDDVDDWVDRFPPAFLALLERRTGRVPVGSTPDEAPVDTAVGRRFAERARPARPYPFGLG